MNDKYSVMDGTPFVIIDKYKGEPVHVLTKKGNNYTMSLISEMDEHGTGMCCYSKESAERAKKVIQNQFPKWDIQIMHRKDLGK